MRATMLLCDAAEAVNGKLYIIGGGWSVRQFPGQAILAVAIRIVAGWNEANEPLPFVLRLVDQDGKPYDPGQGAVAVTGTFEVGRPAGLPAGTDLDSQIAVTMAFPLAAGGYRFELEVKGEVLARESFIVKAPPLLSR